MKYVYYLQSIPHPDQHYIGLTSDVAKRLASHNSGQSPHTAKHRPWKILTYHAFADEAKAAAFEKYLKTCSGHAFRKKHF
ncbi:GIY-YIG nuclease family protein [Geomonas oryzae]|uniref:GIY-YIG nuclease family protein n=1 Tax=Geomonas oryzae TaxID=2364273 RepID=UPI00100B4854|nr:GIY-YIG nuclease family protein [Geomonas oryzae]